MKKILLLFCAMLTCVGMSAKKVDAVWGTPAGNGAWDSENNVYSWTLNYSNLTTVFETPNGELTNYTALHLTTANYVDDGQYRVCFMQGSTAKATIIFYSAGQKDLVFAERSETKDLDLSTIDHISFGGASNVGSITVTNMYLEPALIQKTNGEYDFINIDVLKQEDGSVTTLIPTVENDEYTYSANGGLQFGFKHKNINVKGYDKLVVVYATTSGSWALQPKQGALEGWDYLDKNKTSLEIELGGITTLKELSLFSGPGKNPSAPITIKSIKLHKAPKPSTVEEFTSIEELVANKFYMVTKNVVMAECNATGIDMTTGNPSVILNKANAWCQFEIEPVTYNEEGYFRLHALNAKGEYAYGWWGNAANRPNNNCVSPSMWWGNFEVAMGAAEGYEENGKLYGGAHELGALFTITYVEDKGFAFMSNATIDGKHKYIGGDCKQSDTPYYWNCYNVNAERFQNLEAPEDYVELPISELVATGRATVDGEVINMTNGGGAMWEYDTPQNWSGYKYLVVVPKRRFVTEDQNNNNFKGETTDVRVNINGIETNWIGWWNQKRACVIDLTATYANGSKDMTDYTSSITKVEILKGNGVGSEWSISAAYLTNTCPKRGTVTWEHNASALCNAETEADYYRICDVEDYLGVVCLPYASAICGADAFEFVGVDSKEDPNAIWVRPVMGILEAGKPYVFKTNTNLNVTFYKAGANTVAEEGNENGLYGVFSQQDVTGDNMYAVAGGKFKQAGEYTATVKENRAYLNIEEAPVYGAGSAAVKGCINLFDDDDVTAIQKLFNTTKETIYDLSGRRVQNVNRGIYIMNGKKYIK